MSIIRKNIVGIEFNDGFIRLAEVAFGVGGEGRLVRSGRVDYGTLDDSSLSDEVRKVLVREGITATNASIALPDKHFFQKSLSMPKLSRKDMNRYVTKEARKGLNLAVGEFFVDSALLNESSELGVKKVTVDVLACRKEIVLRFCSIITGAGLVPMGLTTCSASILKMMTEVDGGEGSGPVALIYLGAVDANVIIADGSNNLFSRVLHTAAFREPATQAEADGWTGHIDKIVSETRRTLLYCKKDILGRDVTSVRLAGDGLINDEILKAFRENLDVEVLPWRLEEQSARWKGGNADNDASLFAVGAAVIAAEKSRLQLIPGHLRRRNMSARTYRICASLAFIFLAGGIISFLVQKTTIESLRGIYSDTAAAISRVGTAPAEASAGDTPYTTAGEMEMKKKLLYLFASRTPDFQRALKEVGSSMPDSGYLKRALISRERGQWSLVFDGAIRSRSSLARIDAFAALIDNLESYEGFKEISVTPIESGSFRKSPDFHVRLLLR